MRGLKLCRCVNDVFIAHGRDAALIGNCSSSSFSYSKITTVKKIIEYEQGKSASKGSVN
jgi:hypothetical protein